MKFAAIILAVVTLASCRTTNSQSTDSSVESAKAAKAISVPADDLLAAAIKIQPKSSPFYQVVAQITCSDISREFPPYGSKSSCKISLKGKSLDVANADAIVDALNAARPKSGPVGNWSGAVTITSNASDFPPYKVTSKASIVLK